MRSKWKLGTYFGIDVYLHWSFFFLLAWVILFEGGLLSLLFVVAIFACVVAHEYGHALTARSFGIATRDITLYPIGGIAALTAMPRKPREEMLVALAGPAVNFALAFILTLVVLISGQWTSSFATVGGFATALLIANVILAAFNLIPAFPMDGGRVLRAWLARKHDYVTATDKAVKVGRVFAIGFALIAITQGMSLFLILAAFIYIMAGVERRQVQLQHRYESFTWPFGGSPHPGASPRRDDDVIEVEVVPVRDPR